MDATAAAVMRRMLGVILLALAPATGGCAMVAQIAGESVDMPLTQKVVQSKAEPNILIAVDSSECTVSRERWEKAEIGKPLLCLWSRQE